VNLRLERPADEQAIRDLHLAAFGDEGRLVSDLIDDLRGMVTPEQGLSLVAEDGGQVVGHVMFTPSQLDTPRQLITVQVLSPVAVLPAHLGHGFGSALVRRGLEIMSNRGVPLVFLEGDPGFYSRLGFRAGGEQGFRKPSLRIPDAAFQAIRLPAYEPWMTGTLVYAEVFWRHDAVGLRDAQA
jgi:putative acetyltransferase